MTVTASVPLHANWWTVDDLADMDDDGNRYELIEGSLLVSPAPAKPHLRTVIRLRDLLLRQAPDDFAVGENGGVMARTRDMYLVPDLFVARKAALEGDDAALKPAELLLVVEVLSPRRRDIDLVTKRHLYATMGIRRYWIVDPGARKLTVLVLDGAKYLDDAVVEAGRRWRTDQPFPLELDPAEFC